MPSPNSETQRAETALEIARGDLAEQTAKAVASAEEAVKGAKQERERLENEGEPGITIQKGDAWSLWVSKHRPTRAIWTVEALKERREEIEDFRTHLLDHRHNAGTRAARAGLQAHLDECDKALKELAQVLPPRSSIGWGQSELPEGYVERCRGCSTPMRRREAYLSAGGFCNDCVTNPEND